MDMVLAQSPDAALDKHVVNMEKDRGKKTVCGAQGGSVCTA
jgi:hypothetical protein